MVTSSSVFIGTVAIGKNENHANLVMSSNDSANLVLSSNEVISSNGICARFKCHSSTLEYCMAATYEKFSGQDL